MSLDYSFANSGICISKIIDDKIVVLYSDVFLPDKKLDTIPTIMGLIDEELELNDVYKTDVLVREEALVGRASTAKGVLYARALLEMEVYNRNIEIIDTHNATMKAYCRKYLTDKAVYTKQELKQLDKQQIV